MDQQPNIADRKAEHITIATGQQVEPAITASWNEVALVHNCLPEMDLDDVDLSVEFLGHKLSAPVVISSMTGGHELARSINEVLAQAAEQFGLAYAPTYGVVFTFVIMVLVLAFRPHGILGRRT